MGDVAPGPLRPLDLAGRNALTMAAGKLGDGVVLAGIAWMVGVVKAQPWRRPAHASARAAASARPALPGPAVA